MSYTTKYVVLNHDNGEVMGCDELSTLLEAVEDREDFRGAKLGWVVHLEGEGAIDKLKALED
jgi:hypothetical protein